MSYQEQYRQKLVTAAQAAAVVKSGDWVDYSWTATTPRAVDKELAKRLPDLYDVNFYGGILLHEPEIFKIEDPAAHMTWNSWHMAGFERKACEKGFSFYCALKYSELPRWYLENIKSIDVAILQVGPMDDKGFFNFGPSASHSYAAIKVAKKFIVEVFRNYKDEILKTYLQGGQGNLSAQIVQALSFDFPCLEEQNLIADFFTDFDEAIAAAKKELELWKELKKGLLQQMFV